MRVFVPWIGYESIGGVYYSLEEAIKVSEFDSIDEYEIGKENRIACYDRQGKCWERYGRRLEEYDFRSL